MNTRILDVASAVLIASLVLVSVWTLGTTWLWVALGVGVFVASVSYFYRHDKARLEAKRRGR